MATDIAARGIDVEALGHVVNLDVPAAPEDYIHRVGRTARAELTGEAFTFVGGDEEGDLKAIERARCHRVVRRRGDPEHVHCRRVASRNRDDCRGRACHQRLDRLLLATHALGWAARLITGNAFPGGWALLAPLLEAALWPVVSVMLLAPQRRAPNPDENRPL